MATVNRDSTLTRGHKKKERTRQQLIAAAVDVLAERGEAFSISDVATRAGMANGTFYNYFNDRDELIDAVVPEVLTTFADESAVAVSSQDAAMRFAAITARAFAIAEAQPDAMRVVLRLDAVQRAVMDGGIIGHLRRDLEAGVAEGRFRLESIDAAIDVIVGSLLMTARRIVDRGADRDHQVHVVRQLLVSLDVDRGQAATIAVDAVDAAHRANTPI